MKPNPHNARVRRLTFSQKAICNLGLVVLALLGLLAGAQAASAQTVYVITPSVSGSGGAIVPPGPTNVNAGGSLAIHINPTAGYQVSDVLVDGVSVGPVILYTFNNVQANHTIQASFAPGSHNLTLLFDQSAYPGTVWLQAMDKTQGFQATYGGGQAITFQNPGDQMSAPVLLSDIGSAGLNVTYANGVFLFLFYDDPSGMDRTAAPAYMSVPQRFMPVELTMIGGSGDQADLEAINYFTAPLSLRSYKTDPTQNPPPPALQQTGFGKTTAGNIAGQLLRYCQRNPNAVVTNAAGRIIRVLGPSDSFTPNPNPWPSFIPYTQSIYNSHQQTHIYRQNSFVVNGTNYTFGADMTATALADGSLTITSKITATSSPPDPNLPESGYWEDSPIGSNPWTISAADSLAFNFAIYGQTRNQSPDGTSAVSFNESLSPYIDFSNFCNSVPGLVAQDAYNTTLNMFVGEVATGLIGGFFNSNTPSNYPPDNGAPLKNVPSMNWWLQSPIVAYSQVQPQNPYYNLYAGVIFNNSGNTVYGIPFSDRFGQGPDVNTVNYFNPTEGITYYVNYLVVGIGAPLPQGITIAPEIMLLLGN
jgi:hypothetical protein